MFDAMSARRALRSACVAGLLANAPWASAHAAGGPPAVDAIATNPPLPDDTKGGDGAPAAFVPKNDGVVLSGGFGAAVPSGGLADGGAPIGEVVDAFAIGRLNAGLRFREAFFVGGYIEGGTADANTDGMFAVCKNEQIECAGGLVRFGLEARAYLLPDLRYQPWVGAGFGYERFSFSANDSLYDQSVVVTAKGTEQLRLSGGLDAWLTDKISMTLFCAYSLAEFSEVELTTSETGTEQLPGAGHHWVTFGTTFNLTL